MEVVNEATIERLFEADLVVRHNFVWGVRDDTDKRVRLKLSVANRLGEEVWLHMHIPVNLPWMYTLALVWRKIAIRRLDVRGSHINQCDDGRRWDNETHKHTWRDQYRDGWAYAPTDLPDTPGYEVGHGEHRRVFEAFCSESKIRLESEWVEPVIGGRYQDTIGGA
jgi:hypothetical protein